MRGTQHENDKHQREMLNDFNDLHQQPSLVDQCQQVQCANQIQDMVSVVCTRIKSIHSLKISRKVLSKLNIALGLSNKNIRKLSACFQRQMKSQKYTQSNQNEEVQEFELVLSLSNIANLHLLGLNFVHPEKPLVLKALP